jgi:hypothetical protein
MALPGARTPIGLQGSGWVPGSGTQKLLYPMALPQGPGLGTQIQMQELPSVLKVALVMTALRSVPCSRLQL